MITSYVLNILGLISLKKAGKDTNSKPVCQVVRRETSSFKRSYEFRQPDQAAKQVVSTYVFTISFP